MDVSDQKREPSCDCVRLANDALAAENTVLDIVIAMNLETQERQLKIRVPTMKRDTRSRKKAAPIIARFCPLCGIEYGWKEARL
jgi:hypothetical protein